MSTQEATRRKEDAKVARQVQREWNKWLDTRIKEMEDDLVSLLGRVERLKANLEAAKWVKRTKQKGGPR